ncbi:hypothetical protein [Edaphobacter bradus]|uniref:hypothetical protein n=1 Tax=Edaphobacter bradus TaxID=2259016 RepID=UPI0021DFDBD9|nr:hypothetical protein [Edaphobacter bradus]
MPTNEYDLNKHGAHGADESPANPDSPGYEITDVNVNGIVVFLSGLVGSLVVFFLVCFLLGKLINYQLVKSDGPSDKWHELSSFAGAAKTGGKREDLASNPELQQRELQQITKTFPAPRLDLDDGNQATADLHAREDLFLNYYSRSENEKGIHIPIERAMELIAKRGLPVNAHATTEPLMAGDAAPVVQAPLTDGFARTGYELQTIEAREQKMDFYRAEGAHAELTGAKEK